MVQVHNAVSRWGSSGLACLTGLPDGPPDFSRAEALARATRVAAAVGDRLDVTVDATTLLTGRAGLLGLTRGGQISAGGGTRLLSARDGWCAMTLTRPDDVAAVAALLEVDESPVDPWPMLQRWAPTRLVSAITERTSLLDIPAAGLGEVAEAPPRIQQISTRAGPCRIADLLVADLSSMWAGPLCGQLLARAGATVVKVESPRRPDGTRGGNREFFDWINGEKLSYCLDFTDHADDLRELLAVADIVIEGSRPAALARRGLGPEHIAPRPGRIWLRISGYGEDSTRPAFGDDAAVAGGLVGASAEGPVFCGDAIADPLTGLEATSAVVESLSRGGGELIHVSMAGIAAGYAALPGATSASECPAPSPQPALPHRRAAELGADNDTVGHLISERRLLSC
ncbi:CoA transferase [Mycobacterium montefiorense]|uniref:CoA transferase n=1 Tax=Mycobacterium montefiorense TaxID=154654 RepID=A0ABQ0NMJ0_9MYCO|nr:CoA transferase [Mycobacterium montefiorense]GBG38025.1 CoA transferase [Mycobacterium montefiorense]GKU33826.1 CoA transferase [Mycobacterium montefiorense]GKU43002.1 CoA transferase [Mycobacterium montefiorense]GKU45409.1 CoA transferase [Mycobacterium montefiorense]GKU49297.1 CoA transferase [Mycobacterium montefiorense]